MVYKKQEYKKFRVRTPVKSFRDLEVYRRTTLLSSEIFTLKEAALKNKELKSLKAEFESLYELSKQVPRLIAEGYGDRFSDFSLGISKLERALRIISNIVTKADFIVASIKDQKLKETINKIIGKYQKQRVKINNLRRAWIRVHEKFENADKKTNNG